MDFTRRVTHAYAIPHEAPIRDGGVASPVRLLNRDAVPSSAQHFSLKLYLILFFVGICPAHAQSGGDAEAITCERCHGPSEKHLADPRAGTIVNPSKLAPAARDSICEQCHLLEWREYPIRARN